MKNKFLILIFVLLLCTVLVACSGENEEENEINPEEFSYEMLDLSVVVNEIYKNTGGSELTLKSVSTITDKQTLTEQYYLNLYNVNSYEIRSASGEYGVCDVAILYVKSGTGEGIIESLEKRKDDRINEFLNYDVYNSYETAMAAEIYQEGELVIMLMLPKESIATAKEIIDGYLP